MQQQVSLLVGALASRYYRERPLFGVKPGADVSPPDQSPWVQIPFRRGGIWQPSKLTFLPPAADVAIPNARPLVAYIFRAGGFWQVSKFTLEPAPADVSPTNQPPLRPYIFRPGGLWKLSRMLGLDAVAPVIVIPPPPPPAAPTGTGGVIYIQVGDRKIRVAESRGEYKPSRLNPNWRELRYRETLAALLAAGIITEEEFAMLEAAE